MNAGYDWFVVSMMMMMMHEVRAALVAVVDDEMTTPPSLLLSSKILTFANIKHPPATHIVLVALRRDRIHQSRDYLPRRIHNLAGNGGCTSVRMSRTLGHRRGYVAVW